MKYSCSNHTDKELLEIFPEAKAIIPQKIFEYEEKRKYLIAEMRIFRKNIKLIAQEKNFEQFFVWFWGYAYLKYFYASLIKEIDEHLKRLNRQKILINEPNEALNWNEKKEQAQNQSLYEIALPHLKKLRQSGNNFIALCPFHQEKTPSFHIYQNQNIYHCFGCQEHGNVITFYMKINNLSFKNAVKELAK